MTTILKRLVVVMMFVMFMISIAQVALADGDKETTTDGSIKTSTESKVSADSAKDVKATVKTDAKVKIAAEHKTVKDLQMKKVDAIKEIKASEMTQEEKKGAITDLKAETKGAVKESKEKIKMVKEERKDKLQDVREMVKEKREQFRAVKEKHKDLREEYHKETVDLKKLRDEAKNCKETDVDCKAKKDDVKKGVRMHLVNTVDLIGSSVARLNARVEAAATLSADEKTQALAEIAALQTRLTAQRDAVTALEAKEGVTNEELKTAVKDLKKTWEDVQKAQKRVIAGLINAENGHAAEKHKEYGTSMQKKIDTLKSKGADVAGLVALQTEFVAAQAKLEADRVAALTAWKAAENKADAQDAWKKAQGVVTEDLQKSKEILRTFSALHKELAQKAGVKEKAEDSASTAVTEQAAVVVATSIAADTTTTGSASAGTDTAATTEATASS